MNDVILAGRGRWTFAFAGGVAIVAVFVLLFRLPAPPVAAPQAPAPVQTQPLLKVARPDDRNLMLKQETELRDLRPLFLPTERNAALPEPRLEPGRTFLDSENLKLTFADAEVEVSRELPPVVRLNGKPLEAATASDVFGSDVPAMALAGFGRRAAETGPVAGADRGGFVEAVATRNGERVLAETLPAGARPPGNRAWAPLEMLAVLDAAGLVSPLVIIEGSRVEDVDSHFRKYLTQTFKIGSRLEAGIYRIVVAP